MYYRPVFHFPRGNFVHFKSSPKNLNLKANNNFRPVQNSSQKLFAISSTLPIVAFSSSSSFAAKSIKNGFSLISQSPALELQTRSYSKSKISFAQKSLFRPRVEQKPLVDYSESELSALTPAIRSHLRNVYGTLASTTLIGSVACGFGMASATSIGFMPSLLGGLGLILGIMFTPQQYTLARLGMLYGFAGLEGFTLAPLVAHTAIMSPGAIPAALIGTAGIFTGFTALSLVARSRSMLSLGGPLFGCLLGIVALQIAAYFIPSLHGISHSISLYGGLGLFSAYVAYDTQAIIEKARFGQTDPVSDSLSLFLDVINIFVRLLTIFRRDD